MALTRQLGDDWPQRLEPAALAFLSYGLWLERNCEGDPPSIGLSLEVLNIAERFGQPGFLREAIYSRTGSTPAKEKSL